MHNMLIPAFGAPAPTTAGGSDATAQDGFAALLEALLPQICGEDGAEGHGQAEEHDEAVAVLPHLPAPMSELLAAAAAVVTGVPVEASETPPDAAIAIPADGEAGAVHIEPALTVPAPAVPEAPVAEVAEVAVAEVAEAPVAEVAEAPVAEVAEAPVEEAPLADLQEPAAAPAVPGIVDDDTTTEPLAEEPPTPPADDEPPAAPVSEDREPQGRRVSQAARDARSVDAPQGERGRSPVSDAVRAAVGEAQEGREPEQPRAAPVDQPQAPRERVTDTATAVRPQVVTTPTRVAEVLPTPSVMLDKIAELAELPGPPPHRLLIDLEGIDGARIAVTLRGEMVAVEVAGLGGQATAQWRAEVAAALAARGLLMEGGEAGEQHGDGPRGERREEDTPPQQPRPKRPQRPTTGWRL